MENTKSESNPALYTAWITFLALGVGLGGSFLGLSALFLNVFSHLSESTQSLIGVPTLLILIYLIGAWWGSAMAKRFGGDPKQIAKKSGFTFGVVVLVVAFSLELLFAKVITPALSRLTVPTHVLFTAIFVSASGLIAGFHVSRAAGWLGVGDQAKKLGLHTGLAAALGFFAVNMIMLALGWEVGGPNAAAKFTMITVLNVSNLGAAFAGGWMFGKGLAEKE